MSSSITTDTRVTSPRRVAAASFAGTAIEWYDFFLFGTASALVFDKVFFPDAGSFVASLATFGTFAVGFFARPLGAVLFGHMGDRIGRKSTLVVTLMVMGTSTMLIGLLPTHAQVGALAPTLLIALRIIQGFAVGGEWGGAITMAVEHAPPGKRGILGSWPQVGSPIGLLLSTAVFAAVSSLPDDQFLAWGWRIPFLLSFVLVVVGLVIRLGISESPAFEAVRAQEDAAPGALPIVEVFTRYRGAVLRAMGLRLSETSTYYAVTVFGLAYAVNDLGINRSTMLIAIMLSSAITVITLPGFAFLSDKIGRRTVYLVGAAGSVPMIAVFFGLLNTTTVIGVMLAHVLVINVTRDMQYGPQAALFCELFDARVRVTGASIGSQLGGVVGGGLTPLISAVLLRAGGIGAVVGYVATLCAVCGVSAYLIPADVEGRYDAQQEELDAVTPHAC